MRRRILMCLAVLLLLSGMGAASASDVLAAQSEALAWPRGCMAAWG